MGTNRVIIRCYCQLLVAESLNVWLLRILWHVCIQLDCVNNMMIISLNLLAVSQKFVSLLLALRLTNRQLWLDGKASKPMEYVSSPKQRTIPGQTDTDLAEWQVQS